MPSYKFDEAHAAGIPLNEINAEAANRIGYKYQDAIAAGVSDEDINAELRKRYGYKQQSVPKEKTNLYEDIKHGFMGAANTAATGLLMAGAGAAELVGAKGAQESLFDTIKEQDEYWKLPEGKEQDTLGKVVSAVAGLPMYMNPMLAGSSIAGAGAQRGKEHIQAGGSTSGALTAQAIDTALGVGGVYVPTKMLKGVLPNMAGVGAANMAQEELSHMAASGLRKGEGIQDLPDRDLGDRLAAFVPGAGMGYVAGKPRGVGGYKPNSIEGQKLIDQAVQTREAIATRIEKQLDDVYKQGLDAQQSPENLAFLREKETQLQHLRHEIDQLKGIGDTKATVAPQQKEQVDTPPPVDPNTQITGETFRPDFAVEKNIPSSTDPTRFIEGKNRDGEVVIDPEFIKQKWNKLPQHYKDEFKSERGYQLFVEMHEATHNSIFQREGESKKDYEDRMNEMIIPYWRKFAAERKIPRDVFNNIERIIADERGFNPEPIPEHVLEADRALAKQDTPVEATMEEVPPLDAYASDAARANDPYEGRPVWEAYKEGTLSPAQFRAAIEKAEMELDKLNKSIRDHEQGFDSGTFNIAGALKKRSILENFIERGKDKQEAGKKLGVSFEKKKPANDMTLPEVWNKAKAGVSSKLPKNQAIKQYTDPESALNAAKNTNDIGPITSTIFSNVFGKMGVAKIYEDNPIINYTYNVIQKSQMAGIRIANNLWLGRGNELVRNNIGPFKSLKRIVGEDSPSEVVRKASDEEINKVMSIFEEGFRNGDNYDTTLAKQNFNENEAKLWNTLTKYFGELSNGINSVRAGWFPAVRRGNFMVKLYHNGLTVHAETFRSKQEADHFINKFNLSEGREGIEASSVFDLGEIKKNSQGDFDLTMKITDIIANEIAPMKQQEIKKLVDTILGKPDPYKQHQKHRAGISGYAGSTLFRSEKERAREWREALHSAADEYANRTTRGMINKGLIPVLDSPTGVEHLPNTMDVAKLMRDVAMNNISTWTEGGDNIIRNSMDKLATSIAKQFGKEDWFPKTSVFDKTHGVSTRLFYISSLTARPGFWIAQALSSPLAIREMLRDTGVISSMASAGKGSLNVLYGGSKDFQDAVHWVAQNRESFHPNFINSLTSLSKTDTKNFADKIFQIFSGEHFSTAADSFSRYWAFSMMYEHYKGKGLKGTALYSKAAESTDATMIMYSRKDKGPIYEKAGIVGEAASPLMTFATGNLANFVADVRLAAKTGNVKPALFTILMTTVLGGVIGTTFVAELELLRRALLWLDPELEKDIPSIIDLVLKHNNDALSFGVISAATGYDIGSGLRWNPLISGVIQGTDEWTSLFPALKFGIDTASSVGTTLKKKLGGEVTEAAYRKAQLQLTPGGYRGITDDVVFDAKDRKFVPDKNRGFATVPQTPEERFSTYLGNRTLSTAKTQLGYQKMKEIDARLMSQRQKQVDLFVDAVDSKNQQDAKKSVKRLVALETSPDEILSAIQTTIKNRNMPLIKRYSGLYDGGDVSPEEMRKYRKVLEYHLEK